MGFSLQDEKLEYLQVSIIIIIFRDTKSDGRTVALCYINVIVNNNIIIIQSSQVCLPAESTARVPVTGEAQTVYSIHK